MAEAGPGLRTRHALAGVCSLALGITLVASGCAPLRTAREVRQAATVGFIGGGVKVANGTAETYVLLYAIDRDAKVLVDGVAALSALTTTWSFMCQDRDRFVVGAFKDLNANGVRDPGEPAGYLGTGAPLTLNARAQMTGLTVALDKGTATEPRYPLDIRGEASGRTAALRFSMGEVVTLEDPRFDAKNASAGLWTPLAALRASGSGIFFLKPYDPKRIPVLFVHGIGGNPKDFATLIQKLDQSRYQPWVYYYPSGFRLDRPADALSANLPRLRASLGFKTLYIAAHSMGGLVCRKAILDLAENPQHRDMVGLFVSFAAPYAGHSAVKWGLRLTPEPVPSWLDLEPGSTFLKALEKPLPSRVPFYVLFSFRRGNNPLFPMSSDSVVPVESQLPLWAQKDAVRTWGFDTEHMAILSEDAPVGVFLDILSRTAAGRR